MASSRDGLALATRCEWGTCRKMVFTTSEFGLFPVRRSRGGSATRVPSRPEYRGDCQEGGPARSYYVSVRDCSWDWINIVAVRLSGQQARRIKIESHIQSLGSPNKVVLQGRIDHAKRARDPQPGRGFRLSAAGDPKFRNNIPVKVLNQWGLR